MNRASLPRKEARFALQGKGDCGMKGDVARGSCCERLAGETEEADGWGESGVDERVLFSLRAVR